MDSNKGRMITTVLHLFAAGVTKTKIDQRYLPPIVAYSSAPNDRYLWNKYLLDPVGAFTGEGDGEQSISQVMTVF